MNSQRNLLDGIICFSKSSLELGISLLGNGRLLTLGEVVKFYH